MSISQTKQDEHRQQKFEMEKVFGETNGKIVMLMTSGSQSFSEVRSCVGLSTSQGPNQILIYF